MRSFFNAIYHLFIPKESNNYRAKALHLNFLTFYLIAALSLTFAVKMLNQSSNTLGVATDITVDKLYELTNQQRSTFGLGTLTYNDQLADAARQKAADMFAKNYWAHFGPNGETPWNFITSAGYKYEYAGENLAKNFLFSDGVVQAWMDSPSHRENMLKSDYTDVGFAVVNGQLNGEDTTLVVQMFGKPLTSALVRDTNAQDRAEVIPTSVPAKPKEIVINSPQDFNNAIAPASKILAETVPQNTKTNIMPFYFNMNVAFLLFLILALATDLYVTAKLKLPKIGGKNTIHALFIIFTLVGVYIMINGSVL